MPAKQEIVICWLRRDLRLDDQAALHYALQSGKPVLPVFIFDKTILGKLPETDARVSFLHKRLSELENRLHTEFGGSLLVLHDTPVKAWQKLLEDYSVSEVYTNRDYEPYARKRDTEIRDFLASRGIAFHTFKDQVIFEKEEVVKDDGDPYVVFTPFMRKWKQRLSKEDLIPYPEPVPGKAHFYAADKSSFPSLAQLGFSPSPIEVPEYRLSDDIIESYEDKRNLPAVPGTSRLGPHLRFGTVGIRKLVNHVSAFSNETFLNELIWREFFMQILWHFPHTTEKSFKPAYDRISWRNNEEEFKKWCEGKTGYPLVDAGMRELNTTGFMHNRVRMLTGSFLCKHLLIDWRWGEAYFAEKLLDYEQASNVGNWQWVAGSGVDAAPYFRIFNPTTQVKKFDPDQKYISKWVPDWCELTYPQPIVDHKAARERCLEVYKEALQDA